QSDEGATKASIESIRSLRGEKILISLSNKNFDLDGIKVIHSPLIGFRMIEHFIYALVTIYHAARIRADKVYYFPLCFPNTFPGILYQLHAYILSKISKDFAEILYQTGEPGFLFKAFSRFTIGVTSREGSKEIKKYGLSVAYFPILHPKPQSEYAKTKLRKKYGFEEDDFIVLHVGHLQKNRGLDVLLGLSELMPDIKIIIVLSSMKTKLKISLKRKNTYIIDSYIEDIYEIYRLTDIYVFPIRDKGAALDTPLSILEAKEMSLSIIASDLSNIRAALTDYPEAYFLKIGSTEEMVKNTAKYIKRIRTNKHEEDEKRKSPDILR
ncbi:glycosyltransferase, partial [bacterium]|nr:glycosyltransferase [bacterium]